MRKIEGSSNYLKKQTRKYFVRALLSLTFFMLIFALTGYRVVFQTQSFGAVELAGFSASFTCLIVYWYNQRKYQIYKGGRQGEKNVTKTLTGNLNDDYILINGAYLQGGGGDIDHIVLGPGGVHVLETKNWSGKIVCNGDIWQRPGKRKMGSPSLQVKRNTQKVKQLINLSPDLRGLGVMVEGVVVFTNQHAHLSVNNPTVTILKLQQLPSHIKRHAGNGLTPQQMQQILKQIQNA
ncbi:MAG: nuclease-related domain-containing protein [Candidatus Bathyarchaeia archaeon]|jgi:hypothetical protein